MVLLLVILCLELPISVGRCDSSVCEAVEACLLQI